MSFARGPRLGALFLLVLAGCFLPARAEAQWYFAAYFGANYTHPAKVSVDVPAADLVVDFDEVKFDARPFAAPQYYGWRAGRIFGARRQYGLELEFIHLKVISDTSRAYVTHGRLAGIDANGMLPMNTVVERYSMTHGLNFALVNALARRPLGERVALITRAGIGVTIPHAESTVLGVAREQYEFAGPAGHVAAGLDVKLVGPLSVVGEYKLTYARPEISVAGGTGRTTAVTHQVAFGVALGLTR